MHKDALVTLKQQKAERLAFERMWAAFDDCDPRLMVTPETSRLIETMKERIVAGEPLLRSDLDQLMALLRVEPDPGSDAGYGPFIWVPLAVFFGMITDHIRQNGDGPLPVSVALEALCDASDGLFAAVHTDGKAKSLRVLDENVLRLSIALVLTRCGPPFKPSQELRAELKETFGCWQATLCGAA